MPVNLLLPHFFVNWMVKLLVFFFRKNSCNCWIEAPPRLDIDILLLHEHCMRKSLIILEIPDRIVNGLFGMFECWTLECRIVELCKLIIDMRYEFTKYRSASHSISLSSNRSLLVHLRNIWIRSGVLGICTHEMVVWMIFCRRLKTFVYTKRTPIQ